MFQPMVVLLSLLTATTSRYMSDQQLSLAHGRLMHEPLCLARGRGDLFSSSAISQPPPSPLPVYQSHVTISSFLSPPGLREKRGGPEGSGGGIPPFLCVCVCICMCVRVCLLPKFILTASGSHAYFSIHQRRYKP